jgi:hypothetical protein
MCAKVCLQGSVVGDARKGVPYHNAAGMGVNSDGERSVSDLTVGTEAKSNGAPRQCESEESLR